jgi:glycosyltransferase involved in cell wall biosynthesis
MSIWKGKMPRVAILLRTRERPAFLERAFKSVVAQTFTDWSLLVIHDGAPNSEAEKITASYAAQYPVDVMNVVRGPEEGLGALLNRGLESTQSEFVAIHDDDDSWEPNFLERCLATVGSRVGVVTSSQLVREFYEAGRIREDSRVPNNPWQKHALSLFRLAEGVTFPTISFLFRRSVLKEIGFFNESLAHKEDWEFTLRLCARHPLHFLEEPLANFHYRAGEYVQGPGNLVLDRGEHYAAETEVRNLLLRQDLQAGRAGLGFLTSLANTKGVLFKEINSLSAELKRDAILPE